MDFFEADDEDIERACSLDADWAQDQLVQGIDVGFVLDSIMQRGAWPAALE